MKIIIATFLLAFVTAACSQSKKNVTGNNDSIPAPNDNEAVIVLENITPDSVKTTDSFPLSDTIKLALKEVTTSSGSITSLQLVFESSEGGRATSLEFFLPAAPKFRLRPSRNGEMTLDSTTLPYTISGADYKPYKNALYETETRASAWLQTIVKTSDGADILYFDIEQIQVSQFEFEDSKASIKMQIKLASQELYSGRYGKFKAVVSFVVRDFASSMMMVD